MIESDHNASLSIDNIKNDEKRTPLLLGSKEVILIDDDIDGNRNSACHREYYHNVNECQKSALLSQMQQKQNDSRDSSPATIVMITTFVKITLLLFCVFTAIHCLFYHHQYEFSIMMTIPTLHTTTTNNSTTPTTTIIRSSNPAVIEDDTYVWVNNDNQQQHDDDDDNNEKQYIPKLLRRALEEEEYYQYDNYTANAEYEAEEQESMWDQLVANYIQQNDDGYELDTNYTKQNLNNMFNSPANQWSFAQWWLFTILFILLIAVCGCCCCVVFKCWCPCI